MRAVADLLRWVMILGIWGVAAFLLWQVAWFWAAIWVLPGLYITMNVVGFATLPIYYLIGSSSAKQLLDDIERGDSN